MIPAVLRKGLRFKIDETTREIFIFTHNLESQTRANEADAKKKGCASENGFWKRRYEP